jgi:anti-sigma B factor antagonist
MKVRSRRSGRKHPAPLRDPIQISLLEGLNTVILEITKGQLKDGIAVLTLRGSIHTGPDCRRVEQEVDDLVRGNQTRAILDLTGITHIDSAAIGTVVRCYSKLKNAGGMLRLAGCNGMIDSSLKLTKVDKVIGIFPTVSAAAEDFPLPDSPA